MGVTMIQTREPSRFVRFCDFCGATEDEAKLLISSLNGSHICESCIVSCTEILAAKVVVT